MSSTLDVRKLMLPAYVGLVAFVAMAVLALAARLQTDVPLLGPSPLLFVLFVALYVVAEARPLQWLARSGGGEVTASWAFALALFLVAPASSVLVGLFFVGATVELMRGKTLDRVVFNSTQLVVSLGVGFVALYGVSRPTVTPTTNMEMAIWVAGCLMAGAVAIALNSALTCIAIALSQGFRVTSTIRMGFGVTMAMDGLLIALAPVLVVVARVSLVLLPLLMITVIAIFRSAQLALAQRHDANHDLLTSLPNRRFFLERANLALGANTSGDQRMAVVQIDLDGFKSINDRLGHHIGDLLLTSVAGRLSGAVRGNDLVSRFGGDEFVVLLTNLKDTNHAYELAQRLHESLCEPFVIEGIMLQSGGSFGVSVFPDHATDLDAMLRQADSAMYLAKAAGGGVLLYEPGSHRGGVGRLGLLSSLSEAIDHHELDMAFQPQVDVRTGAVVGAEALLRWVHPKYGVVLPDEFMAAAEQTGMIGELSRYALCYALDAHVQWRSQGHEIRVAVNMSAHDVQSAELPDFVRAELEARSIHGSMLELELTEHAALASPSRTVAVLNSLKAMGVGISLDDFGTGYSSTTSLRTLPVDRLKIDKEFVQGMAVGRVDRVIVNATIEMAHSLGLTVVAEGVENTEALLALQALNCDVAQGFLFSPAVSAEGFCALIEPIACRFTPTEVAP
jgi:diguanylate cyclase